MGQRPDGSRIRVEAGGYKGRLVWVKTDSLPADQVWADRRRFLSPAGSQLKLVVFLLNLGLFALIGLAALLAWNNVRHGRVNRNGANRTALIAVVALLLYWLFSISRLPSVWEGVFEDFARAAGDSPVQWRLNWHPLFGVGTLRTTLVAGSHRGVDAYAVRRTP